MPLAAQEKNSPAKPEELVPVCMARPLSDAPQVKREKRGQPFRILTVERSAKSLEAKGFRRVDCGTADFARADKKNAWRDEICELASTGNEAVQNQLEKAYGERPAVLCASAEMAAGQWERKAKPNPAPKPKADE
ncbi:hypothetical protein QWY75_00270 [Pontixanthobacter aestiaquae]|uniref:Uncharacterized protein n=1 Tax=Pontixanthobacter aestiaquae TaxID=1509367 RepID=A0A844ZF31_9SPHN|nr:hypothetical protein [Pontixanthobacter aestiaquae]MDN3644632.1 hypothetical protein [Pontixanthobacter aestiaquae]MXO84359.1 hypothetical protein [Pontixanthobacter aestiaquae]